MVPLPEMWRSPGASEHPKQGYFPSETKVVFLWDFREMNRKLGLGLAQWTWQRVGKFFLGGARSPHFPHSQHRNQPQRDNMEMNPDRRNSRPVLGLG